MQKQKKSRQPCETRSLCTSKQEKKNAVVAGYTKQAEGKNEKRRHGYNVVYPPLPSSLTFSALLAHACIFSLVCI
jgi:hypothetical protein